MGEQRDSQRNCIQLLLQTLGTKSLQSEYKVNESQSENKMTIYYCYYLVLIFLTRHLKMSLLARSLAY